MPDASIYTIGWICAVVTEYVAARAFLDGPPHNLPPLDPGDPNAYALGKMGDHNVVIAVLPAGEYGITSAGIVATHMVRSFRNIKIGLMVGIGGGAPSLKNDIRLGDIVVSHIEGKKAAVFQFDYGKTIQNKKFENTKWLDAPAPATRAAVAKLKGEYELHPPKFADRVKEAIQRYPDLATKYERPRQSTDILYGSEFVHQVKVGVAAEEVDKCEVVCGRTTANLRSRKRRTTPKGEPVIHYGVIASANQLMKDAKVRDRIAAEENVLCFEMEAAGLMNEFRCLIIRGICDYADSHKNKRWQGYAAMVAAAYAKDLLKQITPKKVKDAETILDGLAPGQSHIP